jgi:Flp pilus assembly pilin Flp
LRGPVLRLISTGFSAVSTVLDDWSNFTQTFDCGERKRLDLDLRKRRRDLMRAPRFKWEVKGMTERLSLIYKEALVRLATLDFKREEGQGVTEYGIVLAFVAVALAAVLLVLKGQIQSFINKVAGDLALLPDKFK